MSIDQYSICPCGSGKKIKFCKCKDSIHEMERVLNQMIDLETFKELLAIVRSILEEQEEIIKETEALKEDDPFGGF